MSDIAFSMSLDRQHLSPSGCQKDYKKGSFSLATFTILYSSICLGLVVHDMVVVCKADEQQWLSGNGKNCTETDSKSEKEEFRHQCTVTKVIYGVLVCQFLSLIVSSFALVKGIYQRKPFVILTWILIMLVTLVYVAVVIVRQFEIEGHSTTVYTMTVLYAIFIITELVMVKHPIKAYRKVRRARESLNRGQVRYDTRNPDQAIFTITRGGQPTDPDSVFKLPTYEEATSETIEYNSPQTTAEDHSEKPTPLDPPPYSV